MNRDEQGPSPRKPYDLSEESSRREDEGATDMARKVENDDSNEEKKSGPVNNSQDNVTDTAYGPP